MNSRLWLVCFPSFISRVAIVAMGVGGFKARVGLAFVAEIGIAETGNIGRGGRTSTVATSGVLVGGNAHISAHLLAGTFPFFLQKSPVLHQVHHGFGFVSD